MPSMPDSAKSHASDATTGAPERWSALLPVLAPVGTPFSLSLSAEDAAGNPADLSGETVRLETERPVEGMPETVTFAAGETAKIIEGLSLAAECELSIRVRGPSGSVLVESNPCRVTASYPYEIRWSSRSDLPEGSEIAATYPLAAAQFALLEAAGDAAGSANLARHYATTGARVFLAAAVEEGVFTLDVAGASPVERVELRDGARTLDVMRPFGKRELGARVRVVWEGAEADGQSADWSGNLYVHGNRIRQARVIDTPTPRFALETRGELGIAWKAATAGRLGGVELLLADAASGRAEIETPHGRFEILLEDVGLEDMCFELGGLGKRLRVYRLPERLTAKTLKWSRSVVGLDARSLHARITFEDGHQAWTRPEG